MYRNGMVMQGFGPLQGFAPIHNTEGSGDDETTKGFGPTLNTADDETTQGFGPSYVHQPIC